MSILNRKLFFCSNVIQCMLTGFPLSPLSIPISLPLKVSRLSTISLPTELISISHMLLHTRIKEAVWRKTSAISRETHVTVIAVSDWLKLDPGDLTSCVWWFWRRHSVLFWTKSETHIANKCVLILVFAYLFTNLKCIVVGIKKNIVCKLAGKSLNMLTVLRV